jgi:hypothetical protein
MGRSTDDPMPPPLNNKFDALPPAEGLKYHNLSHFDIILEKKKHLRIKKA